MGAARALPFVRELWATRLWNRGFAATLGVRQGSVQGYDGDWLVCRQPVVPTAVERGAALRCATVLALLDEWSTACCLAADRKLRGGASMHLRCDLHGECFAGDALLIRSRTIRQGATVGYLEMQAERESDGAPVATGRHVRYLPMQGKALDALWGLCLRPATALPALGLLRRAESALTRGSLLQAEDAAAAGPELEALFSPEALKSLRSERSHANPVGVMHGGAQACIAEFTAAGLRRRSPDELLPRAVSMSLCMAAPLHLGQELRVDCSPLPPAVGSSSSSSYAVRIQRRSSGADAMVANVDFA
eukprot:TRINITY_DN10218_c0_g1_i1.p1 TRINITY_DN10218_c0_g1~~TRINITY_DN10218_c0_g1_i1.p1  ORF type:complete len:306 (+),score=98.01 TRINITY_DN10218_c0_g1_i1:95-1012(+)